MSKSFFINLVIDQFGQILGKHLNRRHVQPLDAIMGTLCPHRTANVIFWTQWSSICVNRTQGIYGPPFRCIKTSLRCSQSCPQKDSFSWQQAVHHLVILFLGTRNSSRQMPRYLVFPAMFWVLLLGNLYGCGLGKQNTHMTYLNYITVRPWT